MRKKSLIALYGLYVARTVSLLSRFDASLPEKPAEKAVCEPVHRDGSAFLVVRLQHLWGEFCRELVVRSAMGGCVTRTGYHLMPAPNVKCVRDIPLVIRQSTKRPFSGPGSQWEDPQFAIGLAKSLQVANLNQITLGLSSVTTLDHLKRVRNFVVHPNEITAWKYYQTARILGFPGLPPIQLINQLLPGGATILHAWVSDLETAAWNAVA